METGTAAPAARRHLFDQGCSAFKRSFPQIAARIPADHFYMCPTCLRIYNELALTEKIFTKEHVPPEKLGGRRLVLTCTPCNSGAGHAADSDARREADVIDFLVGNLEEVKAHLRTAGGRVPIRLAIGSDRVRMANIVKASSVAAREAVKADIEAAYMDGQWADGFTFKVEFARYSPDRAAASWLRSAYLAFFAALGYRFIFRLELDIVRARIKDPTLKEPGSFRIIRPERAEPTLLRIEEPEAFRSYAMFYDHHGVFLPRYGDHTLYERLARQPESVVTFTGNQYPWPSRGPTFYHDFASV